MKSIWVKALALTVTSFALVVSYQNCSGLDNFTANQNPPIDKALPPVSLQGRTGRALIGENDGPAKVTSFQREPWGVRIGLSNQTEVLIYVYKNDLIRIRQTLPQETADFNGIVNKVALVQELPSQSNFGPWESSTHAGLNTENNRIKILITKNPFVLTFRKSDDQTITWQGAAAWKDRDSGVRGVSLKAFADENFMGLGGHGDYSVNRKGIDAKIWNTHIDPDKGNDYQNPFYISSRGYGFLAMNSYESALQLNNKSSQLVEFQASKGLMDYFLFEGSAPKEILQSYHWLTGFPALPPRWAFGLWMSRAGGDIKWFRSTGELFRSKQIPLDMFHMEGITAWTHMSHWDQDLKNLWQFLDEKKIRKGIWQGEGIHKGYSESWWNEADQAKHFTTNPSGQTYMVAHFGDQTKKDYSVVDLGSDSAFNWYKSKHNILFDYGYDNVMVDGGVEEFTILNDMKFEDGRYTGDEYHNIFTQVWAQRVREIQLSKWGNRRPAAYARGGWTGMQRSSITWGGDQCWTYDSMKNLIRKGISEGAAGISFWSQCSGGFHDCWQEVSPGKWERPPRTRNFYERSVQWGAWNPIFRIHGNFYDGVGNEPWFFGAESEKIVSENIRDRYRLLPYFYSLGHHSNIYGEPIMRSMALEFPQDTKSWNQDDQHMVGANILVAPITNAGNSRSVYLPAGEWYDYYHPEQKFAGGRSIQYTTHAEHIPVFVKAGAIIPSAPLVQHIPDGPPPRDLIIKAYRGPATNFLHYEDDGISLNHSKGEVARYKIEHWNMGDSAWLRIYKPEGRYPNMVTNKRLTFELYGYENSAIKGCRLDTSRPIDCSFKNGVLTASTDWEFDQQWGTVSFVVDFQSSTVGGSGGIQEVKPPKPVKPSLSITSPGSNAQVVATPIIRWSSKGAIDAYIIEISESAQFTSGSKIQLSSASRSVKYNGESGGWTPIGNSGRPPASLAAGKTYSMRITAMAAGKKVLEKTRRFRVKVK